MAEGAYLPWRPGNMVRFVGAGGLHEVVDAACEAPVPERLVLSPEVWRRVSLDALSGRSVALGPARPGGALFGVPFTIGVECAYCGQPHSGHQCDRCGAPAAGVAHIDWEGRAHA